MATRIPYEFATNGDTEVVPNTSTTDELSFQDGWSDAYSKSSDESGYRYLSRGEHNYLWNVITANIKEWQQQSFPAWISDELESGTPYSYSKGAIVVYTDGNAYISTSDTNTGEPTVDSTWIDLLAFISGNNVFTDSGSANAYSLTASVTIEVYDTMIIPFVPANTSTGASTVTYNSVTYDLVAIDGSDISTEITSDQMSLIYYDAANTRFKLLSSTGESVDLTRGAIIGQSITPTDASYSTTTITLTVGSHNVLASDTIYVDGITSTVSADEGYVNGAFTVDSVTPTTIVYTATGTPTGTLTATSANVSIGDLVVNGGLDLGQTYTDVSSERTDNVNYTNSSGKPIFVFVSTNNAATQSAIFYVDDIQVASLFVDSNVDIPVFFVVPPGSTYRVDYPQSINYWYEVK